MEWTFNLAKYYYSNLQKIPRRHCRPSKSRKWPVKIMVVFVSIPNLSKM